MNNRFSNIPEFAVLGHPNEGKSSVVSTLTEDDQIRVSPVPGETTVAGSYTVKIDGKDIVRFIDTPGFQVPRQTLAWFRDYQGDQEKIIHAFVEAHQSDPFFADECELMAPVARGAGIIYVVNGARPVRNDDLSEMEILRLTGRPRMAVINSKKADRDYTREWQQEFRKYFNAIRVFNSNTANFHERIRMMESLKSIDQAWEPEVEQVIAAFKGEWLKRNRLACAYITQAVEKSIGFTLSIPLARQSDPVMARENMQRTYEQNIKDIEQAMFGHLRTLFKHNVYQLSLSEYSVLRHDLLSRETWELLGLTSRQLAAAGAVLGSTMGAAIDVAAQGLTFGVFTTLGGLLGAGSAVVGGRRIADNAKGGTVGLRLGGDKTRLGPTKDLQFLYILLDRALIYYAHVINRPHGKRDQAEEMLDNDTNSEKHGITSRLSAKQRQICARFFKAATGQGLIRDKKISSEFTGLVESLLADISNSDARQNY